MTTRDIELEHYQLQTGGKKFYKKEKGKKWIQFVAAISSNLASVVAGNAIGWTSPVFPKFLNKDESPLHRIPSPEELSWIGSLVPLGGLIAPYIAGPLADIIGRKWTLLSSMAFIILSYILLILTCNVPQIMLARLIQGFGVGFIMTVQTMYVGEISSDDCRGALGSFMQIGIALGILYVYCVGPYTSYVAMQYICLIPIIAFIVTFFFMPETPAYFISKGRRADAIKSLKFLRGKSTEGVQEECDLITLSVEEAMKNKGSARDVISNKGNLKALIIASGLLAFQQLSGINAVLYYSQSIFEKAGSSLDPAISTIIIGIVMVVSSAFTPLVVDTLGRKIFLLISSIGMAMKNILLGFYFYYESSEIFQSLTWLPIASLIGFMFAFCLGFGPLPFAVAGELFSPSTKSIASSIVTSVFWIFGFIVIKWFATLEIIIGSYGAFWLFGAFCIIAFIFTLTAVFETKGMTLQQIQNRLNRK